MDNKTVETYEELSSQFIEQYSSIVPKRLHELILTFFHKEADTLDIGCASGRELSFLERNDFKVVGLDAVTGFVEHCQEKCPKINIIHDELPELKRLEKEKFDNILLSAVLMHLSGPSLIEAASSIIRIARPGARILITTRKSKKHPTETEVREQDGRLYHNIPSGKLISLFEGMGSHLIFQEEDADTTRLNITWQYYIFEKNDPKSRSGIDQIQEIIAKDKKDTSYKLALIKALVHVSRYESHLGVYDDEKDFINIPLKRVAMYWLIFYYPLLKRSSPIRQSRSHPSLAFQKPITKLDYNPAEINQLLKEYDENANRNEVDKVLRKISHTIKVGPMKYCTNGDSQVFEFLPYENTRPFIDMLETDFGMIRVPTSIWRDLIFFGHWVEDSLNIQWAKLTERIMRDESFATYLKLLSTSREDTRSTHEIKKILESDQSIECIYSGKSLKKFDVDHVIPYSFWKNNDLWNLLPSSPSLNRKKSDRIPSPQLVKKRKDLIIHYWEVYEKNAPERFHFQAMKALGAPQKEGWQNPMFLSFFEIISRLSSQSIVDVWDEE